MLYNKYILRILIFLLLISLIFSLNFAYLEKIFLYNKELNSVILLVFFLEFLSIKHILDIRKEQNWLTNLMSEKVSSIQFTPPY